MNKYLNDLISSLQWLIRLDSVESTPLPNMPFGEGCYRALEYTLNLAKSLGFKVKNVDGYAGHAEIGEGELFGILGHLDTVPHGSGWSYPPTGGVIDNGRIYGRGALDNKGPILACLYAVKALLDDGYKPNKRIRLIFGCDEESGWECMAHYFQHEEMPPMGFSPDADFPVINCEKGVSHYSLSHPIPHEIIELGGGLRPNMVPDYAYAIVRTKPNVDDQAKVTRACDNNYKIECYGNSVHASKPYEGDNALWKLFKILSDNYQGIFKDLNDKLSNTDGSGCSLKLEDVKSGALTMNLGTAIVKEGILTATIDIRYPISQTREGILRILEGEFPQFTVEPGPFHKPLYVDSEHPLVKTLLSAYNSVMGTSLKPMTIGGGTYARALPLAVAFGPVFPDQESTIHRKDENIAIEDLAKMAEIYYEAIKRLCFD